MIVGVRTATWLALRRTSVTSVNAPPPRPHPTLPIRLIHLHCNETP